MFVLGLRPGTAATLSLWLAVFACLLGCARPAAAAQRAAVGQSVAGCAEGGDDAGDSCCQHGHDSQGRPDKGSHHAKSCCPTETALAERKSAPIALAVAVDLAAMHVVDTPAVVFVSSDASVRTSWHSGREILKKVHVLRI